MTCVPDHTLASVGEQPSARIAVHVSEGQVDAAGTEHIDSGQYHGIHFDIIPRLACHRLGAQDEIILVEAEAHEYRNRANLCPRLIDGSPRHLFSQNFLLPEHKMSILWLLLA